MNIQEQLDNADKLIEAGEHSAAIKSYNDIITNAPECDEAWLVLGSLYGESGEVEKAIDHIEKAILLKPNDSYAYLVLGQIKNSTGELDAATLAFEKALECDPENIEVICTRAAMCQQQGETSDAIVLYEKAVSLDDSLVNAWAMLGSLYFHNNNLELADKCFKKAISFQTTDPSTFLRYCGLLNSIDRSAEVLQLLNSFPEESKSNSDVLSQLAVAYSNEGLNSEALDCINKAIDINPLEKYILNKIDILQAKSDYEQAFDLMKPYLETEPPNASAVVILAKFCKYIDLEKECSQLLNNVIVDQQLSPYMKNIVQQALEWINNQ